MHGGLQDGLDIPRLKTRFSKFGNPGNAKPKVKAGCRAGPGERMLASGAGGNGNPRPVAWTLDSWLRYFGPVRAVASRGQALVPKPRARFGVTRPPAGPREVRAPAEEECRC